MRAAFLQAYLGAHRLLALRSAETIKLCFLEAVQRPPQWDLEASFGINRHSAKPAIGKRPCWRRQLSRLRQSFHWGASIASRTRRQEAIEPV